MRSFVLASLLWLCCSGAALATSRVVAVGDVHGGLAGLQTILEAAGVIDDAGHWAGGTAILVQTGDVLDRGADDRAVMDLLMRLQQEAAVTKGQVIVLLGNHEALNLVGIHNYVNPDAAAAFANKRSERLRERTLKKELKRLRRLEALPDDVEQFKAAWREAHPLGLLEYWEQLQPTARYGRWLRSLPIGVVIDGTLFVHAGPGPDCEGLDPQRMNARIAAELKNYEALRQRLIDLRLLLPSSSFDDIRRLDILAEEAGNSPPAWLTPEAAGILVEFDNWDNWSLFSKTGPLWYRGAALDNEDQLAPELIPRLDAAGLVRVVSGHTVQPGGEIHSRFNGRIILIDTGMLAAVYAGTPSALEIKDGELTAIYPNRRAPVAAILPAAVER